MFTWNFIATITYSRKKKMSKKSNFQLKNWKKNGTLNTTQAEGRK